MGRSRRDVTDRKDGVKFCFFWLFREDTRTVSHCKQIETAKKRSIFIETDVKLAQRE